METVVVTGATGGIGSALCAAFVERGDQVIAGARDPDALDSLTSADGASDARITGVVTDVRDEYDVERLLEVASRSGDGVDIVIPCAVVNHGQNGDSTLRTESYAVFDDTMRTNVRGVYATIREAIPHLNEGSRILVPTCPGSADSTGDDGTYAVSKAATTAVAEGFAQELTAAVALIDPGVVATDLRGDRGRSPADAADLFLDVAEQDPATIDGKRIDQRSRRDK